MTITAKELQSALLRRQISPKEFGRSIGKAESTVVGWLRNGVPPQYENQCGGVMAIRKSLDETEKRFYGGGTPRLISLYHTRPNLRIAA